MTRLVQQADCARAPWDLRAAGDPRTYADLVTAEGLRFVSGYADGLGACKDLLIPRGAGGSLLAPTTVIRDAHRAGLVVHAWTFRCENRFLPADFRRGTGPDAVGDLAARRRRRLTADRRRSRAAVLGTDGRTPSGRGWGRAASLRRWRSWTASDSTGRWRS